MADDPATTLFSRVKNPLKHAVPTARDDKLWSEACMGVHMKPYLLHLKHLLTGRVCYSSLARK